MRAVLALTCLSLTGLCLSEPGVVSLRTFRNHAKHAQALLKRDAISLAKRDVFQVDLINYPYVGGGFYFVNATVGNPPQKIQLDIDTGSSDVWMFGPYSCDKTTSMCAGGSFDPTLSSSASITENGTFQIRYFTQGSGVTGDYIQDSFTIGKQTLKGLTMGLARSAKSLTTGIMGIGFDANEAIATKEAANGQAPKPYPNLIDLMQQQGLISTRSYSLYLDDLEAATGSIVFGGYDKAKFQGDLGILAIQPDARSKTYSSFGVILNSIGVTDSAGSMVLTTTSMPNVVVLDSGTAFTVIPSTLFAELVAYFGAVQVGQYWIVACDLGGMTGTLDYQFAGPTGPLISVPFKELVIPVVNLTTNAPVKDVHNKPICKLGLAEPMSADEPYLFGDTFLRSAYVVYDLDNLQIGIAQTKFSVTDTDIQAISATSGQNLPGKIASVVTTIAQTRTQGITDVTESAITSYPTGTATELGTPQGDAALSGYKTTYANRATDIPGSSPSSTSANIPKKAGAAALQAGLGRIFTGDVIQGVAVAALVFGQMLIV